MPPPHLTSTSRALYRVFVTPALRAHQSPSPIPLIWAPAFAPRTCLLPQTSIRTKSFKRDTTRHAITDHYVIDRAIHAEYINLVDEEGTYHPSVPLSEALALLDRTTHYLVQVSPGKVDEFGRVDPDDLPVCRVMTKMALREQHERKLDLARRQAKGPVLKNLELNWAIAPADMKHRMGRLKEFLEEGRKVEIMLGPKKKGRVATEDEVNGVMDRLSEVLGGVKGAREVSREGTVGGVLMLTLEGKKTEERKKAEENKMGEGRKKREERRKAENLESGA